MCFRWLPNRLTTERQPPTNCAEALAITMATVASIRDKAFRIVEFSNRGGTTSFRVSGALRGKRIRENFATRLAAEARRHELDTERLGQRTAEALRATWLTPEQLRTAEWIFHRTPEPDEVRHAFEWWGRKGQQEIAAHRHADGLSLDDAFAKFAGWLDQSTQRPATIRNLRYRVQMFVTAQGSMKLADVTPEVIEAWLGSLKSGAVTRHNNLRALSRFFAWCIERPQRFITANPAREIRIQTPERGEPEIYSLPEVMRLLVAAKRFREGRFLPFVTLQLFGGLRPTEALHVVPDRIRDGQLRLEARHSKVGRARTSDVDPVLAAWLKLCPHGPVSDPQKSKLLWAQLRAKARLSRWIPDGLRHTAISHYFRRCGSYGTTAEWAGNSEAVIREHYQARTTVAETAAFWSLFPGRKQRQQARPNAEVIPMPKPKRRTA